MVLLASQRQCVDPLIKNAFNAAATSAGFSSMIQWAASSIQISLAFGNADRLVGHIDATLGEHILDSVLL